jgi:hypothetical protein
MRLAYGQFDKEDPTRSINVFDTKLNLSFVLFFFRTQLEAKNFQSAISFTTGHALMVNFNHPYTNEKSSLCILVVFGKNDTSAIERYKGDDFKELADEIAKVFNPNNFPL